MGENALMYIIQNPNMPTEEKLKDVQLLIDHGIDNGGELYQPPKRPKEPDTGEEK